MALGPHERVGKHGVLVAGRVLHETDAGPDCFFSCSLSLPAVIGDSIRYICEAMEANARAGGDPPRQGLFILLWVSIIGKPVWSKTHPH